MVCYAGCMCEIRRGQGLNLGLATGAFAVTFWAWNLIGPLSGVYTGRHDLSPTQTSLLVAVYAAGLQVRPGGRCMTAT